jgi:putative Holliday junction resolvase
VTLWDERLSSEGAYKGMSELSINVTKKQKKLDENSAAFILQGFLDYYKIKQNK